MEQLYAILTTIIGDNRLLLIGAAILLPAAGAFFVLRHLRKVKQDVQRRVMAEPGTFSTTQLGVTARLSARATRVIESMAKAAGADDLENKSAKELRGRLVMAGFYDKSAVKIYFGLRMVTAAVAGVLAAAIVIAFAGLEPLSRLGFFAALAFLVGYFLPSIMLNRRIENAQLEYRAGFPDFMDLMVVCAQAGLSMEAGIAKIGRELASSYPALSRNLEFTTIEIRSGKTLSQSIESLARRLGIDEAKSFATLLSQSEELGSSLSQSLRAYSEDMRNKRLMKAEEKAFSLPAKMVVPLTLFVFPSLLVVLLLPVVVSVSQLRA
ncbi:MAG: type II secretion system F family protein [Beijerinckiaceae bacterium]